MKILVTILVAIVSLLAIVSQPKAVFAQESIPTTGSVVNIYFFWDKDCLHCQNENSFLIKLSTEIDGIQVHSFEVNEEGNGALLQEIAKEYELELKSVPVTFIGGEYLIGFESEETTGKEIEELVLGIKGIGDPDEIGMFIFESQNTKDIGGPRQSTVDPKIQSVSKHPIDKILDKFKADIILGGILFIIIVGFIISKLRKL